MNQVPLQVALAAAAGGGVIGSLARAGLSEGFAPSPGSFPWVLLVINVSGSALLAAVPAINAVRRSPWLGIFLGTGVLGGFTTMSAASTETVVLAEGGRPGLAALYVATTLVIAVLAVLGVSRWTTPAERADALRAEVDR